MTIKRTSELGDNELSKKDYIGPAAIALGGTAAGFGVGHLLKKGLDKISYRDMRDGLQQSIGNRTLGDKVTEAHLKNLKRSTKLRNGLAIAGTAAGVAWGLKKLNDKRKLKKPASGMTDAPSTAPKAEYILLKEFNNKYNRAWRRLLDIKLSESSGISDKDLREEFADNNPGISYDEFEARVLNGRVKRFIDNYDPLKLKQEAKDVREREALRLEEAARKALKEKQLKESIQHHLEKADALRAKKHRNIALKTAGGVALAAGALYGGKKLYDHYKDKEKKKTDLIDLIDKD